MAAAGPTRWGFHELSDPWACRLVRSAGIRRGDLVVDVGAGRGAITAHLVAAGAKVIAVEMHPGRARLLRARFGNSVIVVQADAADLRLPKRDFKVVANPPFGSSTALLRRLFGPRTRLVSADLVLPAPVAARWASGRGAGAGRWAAHFEPSVVTRLPATAFRPSATMPTAVLRLERHGSRLAEPNAPPLAQRTG